MAGVISSDAPKKSLGSPPQVVMPRSIEPQSTRPIMPVFVSQVRCRTAAQEGIAGCRMVDFRWIERCRKSSTRAATLSQVWARA